MGLFKTHDNGILQQFEQIFEEGKNLGETEFLDKLNVVTQAVEKDRSYSTNEKLKIYELLSQICNCAPEDRERYAKKLSKALK